jgi:RNA polymerase sigma-70 factor (ECF subfamily)
MDLKDFQTHILPYKNKLFRFAMSIVGNATEAEDVVQEVFIKIWQNRQQINKLNSLEAWSMKLTKNLSIDKLRSKHRRTDGLENIVEISSREATPDKATELNDTMSRIKALMFQLPEKQRQILQLRDIEGMTYEEISQVLELPLNQIKVNLFRARKQIRAKLLKSESYGL